MTQNHPRGTGTRGTLPSGRVPVSLLSPSEGRGGSGGTMSLLSPLSRSASHCLIPFDRREGLTTAQAAAVAGRTERRVRQWCVEHDLGRRVAGGPWLVSRVALDMFLNSDLKALRAYLAGDRRSEIVVTYYEAAGLRDLAERWQHIPA